MTIRPMAAFLLAALLCGATEKAKMISEWNGSQGGPEVAGHATALDDKSWRTLWKKLGRPVPELDFTRFCAVAAFVGQKPTGGFSVVFDEAQTKGDDLIVRYHVPHPSGMVTQAFTQSWKIRIFARPKGRVVVEVLP